MTDKPDIDPIRRGLGMRLASARQNKNLTQQDVATRFSLNKATVSAWETGRGVPDALTLRDLAKLYDVSADGLLWEDSLTPEAMKFAAAFDGLNEQQKRTLNAIWMAYIQESATDAQVEEAMPVTKSPVNTYVVERENTRDAVLQTYTLTAGGQKNIELSIPGTSKKKSHPNDYSNSDPETKPPERRKHTTSAATQRRTGKN